MSAPGPIAPIAGKLRPLIRLLASDQDGEALAAARAIVRTLKATGSDIHALANSVDSANGKRFSEADAAEIYRRGVEDGRRQAEAERPPADDFARDVSAEEWREIAEECLHHRFLRSTKERGFVEQMVEWCEDREPTERQAAWLRQIHARPRR
jgi:hypothetical protein